MTERSTHLTHENYVNDNPPQASQLFKLASYAMVSAVASNKHRVSSSPRTHFSVQRVEYLNELAPLVFNDYPAEVRRCMSIRIGRQTLAGMPLRAYSLKLFDTSWFERPGGGWDGVRNLYRFEWNQNTVALSDKVVKMVSSNRDAMYERELYDSLDRFAVPDNLAAVMAAEQEYAQVTAGDFDVLLGDVGEYYRNYPLQRNAAS
ncbi:MAG: hypothetical protein WAS27_02405 [Candidatus Saccharimonadales bacterium]